MTKIRITVVFDNVPYAANLTTSLGFACILEGLSQIILFDTDGDGRVL
jgi:metal-dependent hydrolase (beta-lactamase superfamily II)